MTGRSTASEPVARLFLFGPMRAEVGASSIDIPAGNAQRLLAYLVLHPRAAHRREALVDVLWPESPVEQARRALSDTIYRLRTRHRLAVRVTNDALSLDDRLWTDLWEFDRLVGCGTTDDLASAIELHGADLLPAIYDDWATGHRVARRQAYLAALASVIRDREQRGDLPGALLMARQLVVAEPLDEAGHQAYLRLLGRLRRFGEALAHFDELRRLLADELGVDPAPETVAIAQSIMNERGVTRHASAPSTPFVGRVSERAGILAAVDAALDGRGSIVGVEGPAGIGKSRLIDEVMAGARWRGATAEAAGVGGVPEVSALAPLAKLVAPLLRGPLLLHVESVLEPSVLATLAELHPDWSAGKAAVPALSDHAEARVAHALRSLGSAIAASGRVVLAIDDMHRATATLWKALDAFAGGFVRGGGLLLVGYRRPGVEATPGWEVLREWDGAGTATFVRLSPFGVDEICELLPDEAARADEVLALTGGVPFYVTTWSQQLTGGVDGPDAERLVRTRVSGLPGATRSALECAAVIGESVPYRLWADVTGRAPMELAATGEALAAEQWLTPSEAGYAFAHDLLRAAVYDLMDGEARAAAHGRVADALARHDPSNTRARAYHLDQAGRPSEAAEMYLDTGYRARRALSFREAIDALDRALVLLPADDARRLDIALALAESHHVVGQPDRQRPLLTEVVDGARHRGDDALLVQALVLAGATAGRTDDPAGGERLLTEASVVATRLDDPQSTALVAYRYADLMGQQGRWSEALTSVNAALDHARRAGDPSLLGGVLRMRGIAARYTGDPAGSVRWLEEAVAVHRAAGDALEELNSAANLTGAYYELCAWDALQNTVDELLPRAVAYGDPSIIGILLHQSGLAAMSLGDPATARVRMVEARESFASARRQRLVGLVTNTIGLVAQDEGQFDEAMALYQSALEIADELDAATESAYACHDLGALLVELGRPAEAVPLLQRAIRIWEGHENPVALAKTRAHLALATLAMGSVEEASQLADLGLATLRTGFPPGEQAQGWLWALSRVLDALGRRDQARAALVAAGAEVDRQAEAIADPVRRQHFLDRVPLNRAIGEALVTLDSLTVSGPTLVTVALASADAPLGRPLQPHELIAVQWTITTPDDDAVAGEPERRRHRLIRLLREATACGAAPTDDDLARALGVSRRTILRDIAVLGDEPAVAATRRRLRSGERRVTLG